MIVINYADNDIYDDNDDIYDNDDDDDDGDDDKNRNKNKILFPCSGDPNNPPIDVRGICQSLHLKLHNLLVNDSSDNERYHEDRCCCVSLPKQQDGPSKNFIRHKCQICSAQA
jgi:hypothetical protein